MQLYVITDKSDNSLEKFSLLEAACKDQSVTAKAVFCDETESSSLITLGKSDLLYRCTTQKYSKSIERELINQDCTTFWIDWRCALNNRKSSYNILKKSNLSVIPSLPVWPATNLEKVVTDFGLPLIIKVQGGSRGVGVMRVDSLPSLRSLVDFLMSENYEVMLRKYIDHKFHGRLVVVGNEVVASMKVHVPETDFRSNTDATTNKMRIPHEFSDAEKQLAVVAAQLVGVEFAGVDLLIDAQGVAYVAEVNFPCQFKIPQQVTGVDIAGKMVEYLLNKAKAKH